MGIDIKNMYRHTSLDRYEYMCTPIDFIPKEFITAYNLHDKYTRLRIYRNLEGDLWINTSGNPHK